MSNLGSQVALRYGTSLSLATAQQLVKHGVEFALERQLPMAIAVADANGELIAFAKMDNTQVGSIDVAIAKARTSARFRRSTKTFEAALAAGPIGLRVLTMDATAIEGGLPLLHDGAVVGAVGVSGMTPNSDGEVAQAIEQHFHQFAGVLGSPQ